MFIKSYLLHGAVLALSVAHVAAHAAISPALGVGNGGAAVRGDVKRPSNNNPCGNGVNIANALGASTAVTANAAGSFTVDVRNFNGGVDGSRQVTMRVNAAGDGQTFVNGQVTTNGQRAPNNQGTEQITASLPTGTTCTGGAAGNLCVVSFTTAGGFGNCVAVQQGGAAAANNGGKRNGKRNVRAPNQTAGRWRITRSTSA